MNPIQFPSSALLAAVIITISLWPLAANAVDWKETPEWKFFQSIYGFGVECRLLAARENVQWRYERKIGGNMLSECLDRGTKSANDQFIEIVKQTDLKPQIKSVYAKWMTYFGSISSTLPPNKLALERLSEAGDELKVELQTR